MTEGDFSIDAEMHSAQVRGTEIHLTPREFNLILFFARNLQRLLTHRIQLRGIWAPGGDGQLESLRLLIAQLQKKIEQPEGSRYVESERWIGYRFDPGGKKNLLLLNAFFTDFLRGAGLLSCSGVPINAQRIPTRNGLLVRHETGSRQSEAIHV